MLPTLHAARRCPHPRLHHPWSDAPALPSTTPGPLPQVYKLPVKGYRPSRRPNTPRAKLVADDPGERDAHYAAVLRDTKG